MFFSFFESISFRMFFIDSGNTSLDLTYVNKYWLIYSNLIGLFLLTMFLIFIGIVLLNNAKHVKFLNLLCAYYILIYFFISSLNYTYDTLDLNLSFNQNTSGFVTLFVFIATLVVIIFFLSISDVFYIQENSKIEFSLLILFIYIASVYLISSTDFISIIILLECIAFSSYVLIGFERNNKFSATSALQYLIFASVPSGLFILGLSLLYHNFGTFAQDYLILLLQPETSISGLWRILSDKHLVEWVVDEENFFQVRDIRNEVTSVIYIEFLDQLNRALALFDPAVIKERASIKLWLETHWNDPKISPQDYKAALQYNGWLLLNEWQIYQYLGILQLTFQYYIPTDVHTLDTIVTQKFPAHFFGINLAQLLTELNHEGTLNWFRAMVCDEYLRRAELLKENSLWPMTAVTEGWYDLYKILDNHLTENCKNGFDYVTLWNFVHLTGTYSTLWECVRESYEQYILNAKINAKLTAFEYWALNSNNFMMNEDIFLSRFKTIITSIINMPVSYFGGKCSYNLMEIDPVWDLYFEKSNYSSFSTNIFSLSIYLVIILLMMNLCFKLTAAPFHLWAPTVYGGAPLAALTFLSVFSKLTVIFLFSWIFLNIFDSLTAIWQPICLIIAFLSVVSSILGAFSEKIFKRFFVYSSMGHVGFMLAGLGALNLDGVKGTVDYLIIYILSSFIIWFIIMHLSKKTATLVNLKGLSLNSPFLALIFAIVIFSFSGIPPMGGFFVKYEIFYSLIHSSLFYLAYLLLILTIISFFYYLRLIKIIYFENNKYYYKNKFFGDIKLRLIAYGFFLIPLYMIFNDNPLSLFLKDILKNSVF